MKEKKRMMLALLLVMLLALGTGCAAEARETEPVPITEEVPQQVADEEEPPAEEAAQPQPDAEPAAEPAPQPVLAPAQQEASLPTAAPAAGTDELFSIQSKLTRAELWTQGSEKEESRSAAITDPVALEQIRQAINALEEQPGSGDAKASASDPWTAQLDLTLADGSQFSYGLRVLEGGGMELDATIWVDASGQNRPAERSYYTTPDQALRTLLDQLVQQYADPMVSLDPKGWMGEGMRFLLCDNQSRLAVWLEGNPFAGILELDPIPEEQLGKKREGWELRLTGKYTPLRYELYENGLKVTYHTGDVYIYRMTAQQRQQLDAACTKAWEGETVPSWLGIMSESKMEELILTRQGSSRSLGMDAGIFAALRQLTVSGPARTDTPMPDGIDRMEIRFNTGVRYTIGWQEEKLWVASSDMPSQLSYPLTESSKKWLKSM